ncbi:MAG: hypothetical protein ACE3K2_02255 [Paenibacillus sp.]|uniref:hypothetical protein n=1 Tax=Paenibacillus sp. TaxID=58172 RepID=UPI003B7E8E71
MSFLNDRAFIGAIIGAIASLLGGFFASKYQLKRMEKAEDLKQKQRIKVSSQIIYGDIITLVKAMLYYRRKEHKIVGFYFDYSADYSNHIDVLTERIGGDKTYLLRRIYGHLVNLHHATMASTINSTEINLLASPVYEAACKLLYGSTGKFIGHTGHLWETLTEENYDHLTDAMEHKVKNLIDELEKIKSECL